MLKRLVLGFIAIDLLMVFALVYYATARGGGSVAWILAAIWAIALVLIPLVAVRPALSWPQRSS